MNIFMKAGILACSFLVFSEVEASDRRGGGNQECLDNQELDIARKRITSLHQNIFNKMRNLSDELKKPYISALKHKDYDKMMRKNASAMKEELGECDMKGRDLLDIREPNKGGFEDLKKRGVNTEKLKSIIEENKKKTVSYKLTKLSIDISIISTPGDKWLVEILAGLAAVKNDLKEIRDLNIEELNNFNSIAGEIITSIDEMASVAGEIGKNSLSSKTS